MEGPHKPHSATGIRVQDPCAFPAATAGSRTREHRVSSGGYSGIAMATALMALLTGVFARGSRNMKTRIAPADTHADPSRDPGASRVPAVQPDLSRVAATLPEGVEIDWP